jgi:hypothetical protein
MRVLEKEALFQTRPLNQPPQNSNPNLKKEVDLETSTLPCKNPSKTDLNEQEAP